MNADPLEVMLLNMGYRISGVSEAGGGPLDDQSDVGASSVRCSQS